MAELLFIYFILLTLKQNSNAVNTNTTVIIIIVSAAKTNVRLELLNAAVMHINVFKIL